MTSDHEERSTTSNQDDGKASAINNATITPSNKFPLLDISSLTPSHNVAQSSPIPSDPFELPETDPPKPQPLRFHRPQRRSIVRAIRTPVVIKPDLEASTPKKSPNLENSTPIITSSLEHSTPKETPSLINQDSTNPTSNGIQTTPYTPTVSRKRKASTLHPLPQPSDSPDGSPQPSQERVTPLRKRARKTTVKSTKKDTPRKPRTIQPRKKPLPIVPDIFLPKLPNKIKKGEGIYSLRKIHQENNSQPNKSKDHIFTEENIFTEDSNEGMLPQDVSQGYTNFNALRTTKVLETMYGLEFKAKVDVINRRTTSTSNKVELKIPDFTEIEAKKQMRPLVTGTSKRIRFYRTLPTVPQPKHHFEKLPQSFRLGYPDLRTKIGPVLPLDRVNSALFSYPFKGNLGRTCWQAMPDNTPSSIVMHPFRTASDNNPYNVTTYNRNYTDENGKDRLKIFGGRALNNRWKNKKLQRLQMKKYQRNKKKIIEKMRKSTEKRLKSSSNHDNNQSDNTKIETKGPLLRSQINAFDKTQVEAISDPLSLPPSTASRHWSLHRMSSSFEQRTKFATNRYTPEKLNPDTIDMPSIFHAASGLYLKSAVSFGEYYNHFLKTRTIKYTSNDYKGDESDSETEPAENDPLIFKPEQIIDIKTEIMEENGEYIEKSEKNMRARKLGDVQPVYSANNNIALRSGLGSNDATPFPRNDLMFRIIGRGSSIRPQRVRTNGGSNPLTTGRNGNSIISLGMDIGTHIAKTSKKSGFFTPFIDEFHPEMHNLFLQNYFPDKDKKDSRGNGGEEAKFNLNNPKIVFPHADLPFHQGITEVLQARREARHRIIWARLNKNLEENDCSVKEQLEAKLECIQYLKSLYQKDDDDEEKVKVEGGQEEEESSNNNNNSDGKYGLRLEEFPELKDPIQHSNSDGTRSNHFVHTLNVYAGELYQALGYKQAFMSMDETALLTIGIIMEEAVNELLGPNGHKMYTEVDQDAVATNSDDDEDEDTNIKVEMSDDDDDDNELDVEESPKDTEMKNTEEEDDDIKDQEEQNDDDDDILLNSRDLDFDLNFNCNREFFGIKSLIDSEKKEEEEEEKKNVDDNNHENSLSRQNSSSVNLKVPKIFQI